MIQIAIYGYGNLGRGVECAARQNADLEVTGVYTRRDPASVQTLTQLPVYRAEEIAQHQDEIDVVVICGGSATDLPEMTAMLAERFTVVDSFDTHARIPDHFAKVDAAARRGGNVAVISCGWDPGLFSLMRLYGSAILPESESCTFWGRGVSQGHSDAIRRLPHVVDARQYTVPIPAALDAVRSGAHAPLTAREKHLRECWVVAEEGADQEAIARQIKTMPNYFDEYDTTVQFISLEELRRDHAGMPHGGVVITGGVTGLAGESHHTIEYKLTLDSNPEFTASVLAASARAAVRMRRRGDIGCKTVFDIAPADLSPLSGEELRAHFL